MPVTHGEDVPIVLKVAPPGRTFLPENGGRTGGTSAIILICGHYGNWMSGSGRIWRPQEISIANVLTGGELSAMVIMDAISQLVRCSEYESASSDSRFRWGFWNILTTQAAAISGDGRVPESTSLQEPPGIEAWHARPCWGRGKGARSAQEEGALTIEEKDGLICLLIT